MPKQFQIQKNNAQLYPGLKFETFQVHVQGEISFLKPGERLVNPTNKRLKLIVQSVQVLHRKREAAKEKQEAVVDVRFMSRDPNAFFPPDYLKKRQILEVPGT